MLATSAALWVVLGYLAGSIPSGVLVTRLAGAPDPRTVGSGNIGATNVMRAGGKRLGAVVLLLDALKGFLPAVLASSARGGDDPWALASGLAAVVGHCYSVWLRLAGGRGVATALGVGLAVAPMPTAVGLAVFVAVVASTRVVSLSSLAAVWSSAGSALLLVGTRRVALLFALAALLTWRHRANLVRLVRGEEPRLGRGPWRG